MTYHLQRTVVAIFFLYSTYSQSINTYFKDANFTLPVLFPHDKAYRASVVMANYDCRFLCPHAVVRPVSAIEVADAIKTANRFDAALSIRGGGHGYTCQGSKAGGIMLDMRNLRHIGINGLNSDDVPMSVTIGTGFTWGEVLKYLRKVDKDLITVHGQCTSVGVAGYALHGGVHFGGLSELYGLASDNILSVTAVVANGSIVELTESRCDVDGVSQSYSSECAGLWFGLRGAGSSFGVVTSLTLKLHREPKLQSALSVLSLKVRDATESQKFLSAYMKNIPEEVSLTFFGLDYYFKAYSFILLFAGNKGQALFYDFPALLSRKSEATVHFIVEASWPLTPQSDSSNNSNRDGMLQRLNDIHTQLRDGSWSDVVHGRKWMTTHRTWSVPSYDLVWGAGHSYGGATMIVDEKYEAVLIEKTFETFKAHLDGEKETETGRERERGGGGKGKCSDCVLVFHRIGEKLKNKLSRPSDLNDHVNASSGAESFNPFRQNGTLWVEMDCGHFYPQRDTWPVCKAFIDDTQRYLDTHVPLAHKSHYPNVPNLATEDWRRQYYGEEGYERLQGVKDLWDADDVFHHSQSIAPSHPIYRLDADREPVVLGMDEVTNSSYAHVRDNCVAMYDKSARRDLRNRFDLTRPISIFINYFRARQ